jgi:hypothetical protein
VLGCRYDIYTYSRPAHPLAYLGYPVVRFLQQRFRIDSLRTVARAVACRTVDASLDDATRRRLELMEEGLKAAAQQRRR